MAGGLLHIYTTQVSLEDRECQETEADSIRFLGSSLCQQNFGEHHFESESSDEGVIEEDIGDDRPISPADNIFSSSEESSNEEEQDEHPHIVNAAGGAEEPVPHDKLNKMIHQGFNNVIDENVCATPGEVLLNAIELSQRHNLPHDAHANLLKFVNSLFSTNVVPDSRYLLDELYFSASGMKYHFFCEVCQERLPNVHKKSVGVFECVNVNCKNRNDIKALLNRNCFFVTINIQNQLQILLRKDNVFDCLKCPSELVSENTPVMKDMYGGKMYKEFAESLDYTRVAKYISFTLCIDGTPLFKSSGSEVWPIFLSVNELSPFIRMPNLILVGFWFGVRKPNFSCLFEVVVKYLRDLSSDGFTVDINGVRVQFYAYVIACCIDSGARGSIQEVHLHNGEFGCNWCLHPGQRVGGTNNARMYCKLDYEPQMRTKELVLRDGKKVLEENRSHVNGVIGVSLLVALPKFDIVQGMIVDSLHAKYLGCARQFAKLWLGTDGIDRWVSEERPNGINPPYYIGTGGNVKHINNRIAKVTPPVETRRMPRDIQDVKYLKARDWENFVLFISVLVLKDILSESYLNHWILFVQGCHLLMQHKLTQEDIDNADSLLNRFADEVEGLYRNGDKELTPETPCKQMKFNVHLLRHAADNARRWGADWCISSYAYEGGNFLIKKMIKSNKGIPNQILRQVSQDVAKETIKCSLNDSCRTKNFQSSILKNHVAKCLYVGTCVLLGDIKPLAATEEETFILSRLGLNCEDFVQCSKVIVNHCVYTIDKYEKSTRRNNSVVRLVDNSFAVIRKIIACEASSQVAVFTSAVRVRPYTTPGLACVPVNRRFLYTVSLIEVGKQLNFVNSLDIICVYSNVGPLGPTISPMPHIYTLC